MDRPYIVVVGSANTDMVIRADRLPQSGETILGGKFFMNAGGKGANQSVAAARLGGNVLFIARTGNDIFGRQSLQLFSGEGIDISYMVEDPENPSGIALITVDKHAENCIVVASGANAALDPSDILKASDKIREASIVLVQLEIPMETVEYVVKMAAENNIRVVLNPAPSCPLSAELLRNISVITPNETEAGILTGIKVINTETAKSAAKRIHEMGVETVIITLGSRGAMILNQDEYTMVTAALVQAIDTTAAGDVFNGALAVALCEGTPVTKAVQFACRAASISVTRLGAQSSAPYRHEITI